jgi:hypothetical protein
VRHEDYGAEQDAGPNDEERGHVPVPIWSPLARSSSPVSSPFGIMSDDNKTAPSARLSFSALAALYSVIIPLITPVVWFIVLAGSNGYLVLASTVASCLLGTSLLAAVASLICGHAHRRYLLIAWIGIVLSAVLGFFSLVFRSMPIC